jgi:hypothetical protein
MVAATAVIPPITVARSGQAVIDFPKIIANGGSVKLTPAQWNGLSVEQKETLVLTGSIDLSDAPKEFKDEIANFISKNVTIEELGSAAMGDWEKLGLPKDLLKSLAKNGERTTKLLTLLLQVSPMTAKELEDIGSKLKSGNMTYEDIMQLIFKLYSKLRLSMHEAVTQLEVTEFNHKIKAADERLKSAIDSAIAAIVISGVVVIGGVAFACLAARSGIKGVKDPGKTGLASPQKPESAAAVSRDASLSGARNPNNPVQSDLRSTPPRRESVAAVSRQSGSSGAKTKKSSQETPQGRKENNEGEARKGGTDWSQIGFGWTNFGQSVGGPTSQVTGAEGEHEASEYQALGDAAASTGQRVKSAFQANDDGDAQAHTAHGQTISNNASSGAGV